MAQQQSDLNRQSKDRKDSLILINDLLAKVKSEMNQWWNSEDRYDELILFIQDKRTNPWRKQAEDIEGDVSQISAVSPDI